MSLASLLINPVTVKIATYSNVKGVRTPTYTNTSAYASVQPMSATAQSKYGIEDSSTGFMAYFQSNPGVKAGDQIVWNNSVLSVLGPASDQAGRGRVYAVACSL